MKLDREKIAPPLVEWTPMALKQLELIFGHDKTLEDKVLRLHISGKGCHGFDYSLGFTESRPDDFRIPLPGRLAPFSLAMDPFSTYYLHRVKVDFVQDFEHNNEGFVITNEDQGEYGGKFWKKSPDKVPPLV